MPTSPKIKWAIPFEECTLRISRGSKADFPGGGGGVDVLYIGGLVHLKRLYMHGSLGCVRGGGGGNNYFGISRA